MMAERTELRFGGTVIPYAVERTRRCKTVSIAVEPGGQVHVKAPAGASMERIQRIVHGKASWIIERRRRQEDMLPEPEPREFVSGETFRYLGRQYRLRVIEGAGAGDGAGAGAGHGAGAGAVRLERGWLVAEVEPGRGRAARVRESLIGWYRGHAERRLPARVAAWAPRLGVEPADVLVREQKRRWGSCDVRGIMRLNWRIVQAPARLQDYVVVHELAHLIERDHTRDFWAMVGNVLPDYEARREALRKLGSTLVW
jgi:predicted metal-dependent hydrolase